MKARACNSYLISVGIQEKRHILIKYLLTYILDSREPFFYYLCCNLQSYSLEYLLSYSELAIDGTLNMINSSKSTR